jgi:hypothetical protein
VNAPIRVRLTAWYVLVLAVVMVALGAFVATRLRSDLTSELDRTLQAAAGQIARGYEVEGRKEFRDLVRTVLPGPSLTVPARSCSTRAALSCCPRATRSPRRRWSPWVRASRLSAAAA